MPLVGDQTAASTSVGVGFRTDEGTPTAAEINLLFISDSIIQFLQLKATCIKGIAQ